VVFGSVNDFRLSHGAVAARPARRIRGVSMMGICISQSAFGFCERRALRISPEMHSAFELGEPALFVRYRERQ